MKTQVTVMVLGAQYYDIEDEATKKTNRYTAVFTAQPLEAEKVDRVGSMAGKVRCNNSEVVRQLRDYKLPAEVKFDAEITVNAKGESRLTLTGIAVDASALPPRKAA